MILHELELRHLRLPLVSPFSSAKDVQTHRDVLVIRVGTDQGDGWSECVAMNAPTYSAEWVDGAEMVIATHLWPRLGGELSAADITDRVSGIIGHPMAKAAVEAAVLDAELRSSQLSLHDLFGRHRDRVPAGIAIGVIGDLDELLAQARQAAHDGYRRIKIKIGPGWDLEPVRCVRQAIGPDLALQVDANGTYHRSDIAHLGRLDDLDLVMIEQPFAPDDLISHIHLGEVATTPVCLDESIISLATAATAIELGAAQVISIKPGRVGGYLEARRIHDLCMAAEVPVWCGGMLETGLGRAPNIALAALPGFTLTGDLSASERFYSHDIVIDPVTLDDGYVKVPTSPGLGFEIDHDYLDSVTISSRVIPPATSQTAN
ncbi:MAG: o-succinylbenzoate synthase [Ilumatobacter coccineus]|uniref:o-succinylbenzoate synthase n=1 Tax=Ilumatobacter coccineus TaxID=467094 RepID=A0A2G6KGH8_9ACTN|nr:MAG: o-succinylbenzoate synthase [Ilumatobacter coccineus]